MRVRGFGIGGVVLAFFVWASVALAQNPPTGPTYGGRGPDTDSQVDSGDVAAEQVGFLPFTGRDLALIVLGALLLVGMGLLTRRVARNRDVAK
jgi:hypothetical protein